MNMPDDPRGKNSSKGTSQMNETGESAQKKISNLAAR
jgi:hypothetical protein